MNPVFTEFPFALSPELWWFVFLAILGSFAAYSMFLVYHWFRYGMNILVSLIAAIIYFSLSAVILIVMFYSVILLI